MLGGLAKHTVALSMEPAQVNGYPALVVHLDGELDTVVAVRFDEGRISGLYAVRNPDKLSHMHRRRPRAAGRTDRSPRLRQRPRRSPAAS